jgi:hypothetical protein
MLRVAFLSYTLILPALFAPAVAGQLDFGAENLNSSLRMRRSLWATLTIIDMYATV